jgi:phosphate transport system protein
MQQATSGHTIKAFDEDIERLRALISQMGGLAEHAIGEAMRCLVQRDVEGAAKIILDDKKLDALEVEAERRAVQLIALRAPMAGDLRDVVAALKISGVVERIGDYAKNIARRVPMLEHAGKIEPLSLLPEMARIATAMVHDVLDAFVERDAEAAVRVSERDSAVDDFYDSIFRTLLTHMMENPHTIGQAAHLLFIAKNLERVGDHATSIAEIVHYEVTGEEIEGERPKWSSAGLPSASEA